MLLELFPIRLPHVDVEADLRHIVLTETSGSCASSPVTLGCHDHVAQEATALSRLWSIFSRTSCGRRSSYLVSTDHSAGLLERQAARARSTTARRHGAEETASAHRYVSWTATLALQVSFALREQARQPGAGPFHRPASSARCALGSAPAAGLPVPPTALQTCANKTMRRLAISCTRSDAAELCRACRSIDSRR